MFGRSSSTLPTRGRGTSRYQSARGRDLRRSQPPASPHQHNEVGMNAQGQQNLGKVTEARNDSRGGSSDSDRPLFLHAQGDLTTAMDTTAKSMRTDFTLNNTSLSVCHQIKYLEVVRRNCVELRPSFARVNK